MLQPALPKAPDKLFADFYLSEQTLHAIDAVGYRAPTPVQAQSIPLIIAGIDLIVMSQTGTGKTAAFAIPTIEILDPVPGQIDILVLAPTRELAIQVSEEFENLGKFKGINVATIYGGSSYEKQYDAIDQANVIVATPGRLVDLIQTKKVDLSGLKHFILDEADEMLSMGFAEDLDKIIEALPEDRQSLLFSATITNEVKSLAKKLLFYPEFISMSDDSVAAHNVTHVWYPVRGVTRTRELLRVIEFEQPEQAIVFANTKSETVKITNSLVKHGINARVLNGDLPQSAREKTLQELRDREFQVLVATDVAARGIDIEGLTHVFNYVVPSNAEVYIHRTGRTGRAGKKGRAISLVSPAEFPTLHAVKKHYGVTPVQKELPTTRQIIEAKRQRHLDQLSQKLTDDFDLPYGAKIGLANQLIQSAPNDPHAAKLIARLLTLSDSLLDKTEKFSDLQKNQTTIPTLSEEESTAQASPQEVEVTATSTNKTPRSKETSANNAPSKEAKRSESQSFKERSNDSLRSDKPEKTEKSDRTEKSAKSDKFDRTEKTARPERADKPEKYDKPSKSERPDRYTKTEVNEKAAASASSEEEGSSRRRRRRAKKEDCAPVKSSSRRKKQSSRRQQSRSELAPAPSPLDYLPFAKSDFDYKRMWINLGSSSFDTAEELRDALVLLSGFGEEDFGPISLEQTFSIVDVREDYFEDVIYALNEQKWGNTFIAVEAARK